MRHLCYLGSMEDNNTDTIEREDVEVKQPNLYTVRLMNDDFTPMNFVIAVLMQIFRKSQEDAEKITMAVHNDGSAIVGIYTRDIAETKVQLVVRNARAHQHPLVAEVEPA